MSKTRAEKARRITFLFPLACKAITAFMILQAWESDRDMECPKVLMQCLLSMLMRNAQDPG